MRLFCHSSKNYHALKYLIGLISLFIVMVSAAALAYQMAATIEEYFHYKTVNTISYKTGLKTDQMSLHLCHEYNKSNQTIELSKLSVSNTFSALVMNGQTFLPSTEGKNAGTSSHR